MPRKKLSKLNRIDGKLYNRPETDLDDMISPPVNNEELKEYEKYLQGLNQLELHHHAIAKKIIPKEDRASLVKLLIKDFKANLAKTSL